MKNKVTLLNSISSLFLQIITVISGFIIPKIILSYFGSEVNGLVSSLTQFLSYISLLEGGVTGVITANLYKPLIDNNKNKISSIIKTTNKFYRSIGLIFVIYSIGLAVIYPIVFKTGFSYLYVVILTLILSLNLLIQYCFSLTLKTLLTADKKVYIVSISQSVMIILNIILAIISVKIYPSIHLLKLITGLLFLIQPLVYGYYVKKHYDIDHNAKEDKNLLKERWNGFAINIAAFIHFSTDITILTLFTNLQTVSVYSVYALVTTGLRNIINAIASGINPTIGQLYAKGNKKELNNKFELYEFLIFIIVFFFFSVAGLLITGFVMIYTKNIHDANYNMPLFGILLIISEALYLIKLPHLNLAYSANKFKEITKPCYIEALLNIIISLLLVKKLGLIGVAIGTIVAMLYRMIYHVYFTNKYLISRKQNIFYKKMLLFCLVTVIGIIICIFGIPSVDYNVMSWGLHAIIYSIIFGILYLILGIIFYKENLKSIFKYLKK